MSAFLLYLIKVIVLHGLFYGIYSLLFRNSGRHTHNRIFLLFSFFLSLVIPILELPYYVDSPGSNSALDEIENVFSPVEENLTIVASEKSETKHDSPLVIWITSLVLLIWLSFTVKWISFLRTLKYLKIGSEKIKYEHFTLFLTNEIRPFSFFRNVFIPFDTFKSDGFNHILAHETEHVKQWHSLDRIFMNFAVSLFWFNPFIYLYRNALIEIHEYQADKAVIKRFSDPIGYQEVLFSQLSAVRYSGWVSHFNVEIIKKRIVMMNKKHKMNGWIYSLILPITLTLVFAFSSRKMNESIGSSVLVVMESMGPKAEISDFGLKELQGKLDNIPQIMPLEVNDRLKVTSTFGRRKSPFDGKMHHHRGIDLRCPLGTNVLATGDATVVKVQRSPKGFGNMVVLKHGENFKTRYAHLSKILVEVGQQVKKGEVIAESGNSGMSTAPHLHYEVVKEDLAVDPVEFIKDYKIESGISKVAE